MRDAQQRVGMSIERTRAMTSIDDYGSPSAGANRRRAERKREAEPPPEWNRRDRDGLAHIVSNVLAQGCPEEATRLFAEAQDRQIVADWPTSDRVATTLLHLGRPADASQLWEHVATALPPAHRAVRIATAALAALDFSSAERDYHRALELDPTLGEAWFGLAWLHTQRGDSTQALTACREGLRRALTPPQTSVLQNLQALIEALKRDR